MVSNTPWIERLFAQSIAHSETDFLEGISAGNAFGFVYPIINSPLPVVNENPLTCPNLEIYRKYDDFQLNFCREVEFKLKQVVPITPRIAQSTGQLGLRLRRQRFEVTHF